jgi:hypothetical protein
VAFRSSNGGKKVAIAAALVAAASLTLWSMSRAPRTAPIAAATAEHAATTPAQPIARATAEGAPRAAAPAVTAEPIHAVNPANLPIAKDEPAPKTAPASHHAAATKVQAAKADTASDEPAAAPTPPAPAGAAAAATSDEGSNEIEFNREAAKTALDDAGQKAASCRTVDTPAGPARVSVTFAPSGNVTSAVILSGPLVGTPAGGCLTTKLRTVRVPAFTGDAVSVTKTLSF